MSPPPCVITPKTSVVVRRGGFLVDGVERPTLSGCKFVGEVRLSVGVGDEPPAPPPSAPAPACSASDLLALVGAAVKGGEAREDKGASA